MESRPYVVGNFVQGVDGVVSYSDVPGHVGGGDVSGFNPFDQLVMALLRLQADAVAVGANTLRSEPQHLWTPEFIAQRHMNLYQKQRESVRKAPNAKPLNLFVTASGNINVNAAVFERKDIKGIVVTTEDGVRRMRERSPARANNVVVTKATADGQVDLYDMMRILKQELRVSYLLVEGGPLFYNGLEQAHLVDELFLTISPRVVGNSKEYQRPTFSVAKGRAYKPEESPALELLSLKEGKSYLYMRWKYLR
jgi:riboflavin biosynthesis pyrimidine reductase